MKIDFFTISQWGIELKQYQKCVKSIEVLGKKKCWIELHGD